MTTSKATLTRKAVAAVKAAVRALPSDNLVEPSVLITTPAAMTHAEKDREIAKMLGEGFSFLDIQNALKCGPNRISRVNRARPSTGTPAAAATVIDQVPAAVITPVVTQETPARELAGIILILEGLEARKKELKNLLGAGDHGDVVILEKTRTTATGTEYKRAVDQARSRAIAQGNVTLTRYLEVNLKKK